MILNSSLLARRLVRASVAGLLATVALSVAASVPPGTDAEIAKRIKPIGELRAAQQTAAEDAAPKAPRTGKELYGTYCQACHATGVAGAPKYGDKAAWAPRIAQGMDVLYKAAWNGINSMPPKGTCSDCSQEELDGAVDYIVAAAK